MPTEPGDNGDLSDVRALLADAKADEGPPLRISPQLISQHARRVKGRRRQLAMIGSTMAVIALVAVLATTLAKPRVEPAGPAQLPAPHPPIATAITHQRPPATTRITPRTTVTTSGVGGATPTP